MHIYIHTCIHSILHAYMYLYLYTAAMMSSFRMLSPSVIFTLQETFLLTKKAILIFVLCWNVSLTKKFLTARQLPDEMKHFWSNFNCMSDYKSLFRWGLLSGQTLGKRYCCRNGTGGSQNATKVNSPMKANAEDFWSLEAHRCVAKGAKERLGSAERPPFVGG